MADFLARSEAPLTDEEWGQIDQIVTTVAKRLLVGRRFLDLFGPLGAGLQDLDYNVFHPQGAAMLSLLGNEELSLVQPVRRMHQQLPMIYKDFALFWRDIESAHRLGIALDTGSAAAAAAFVAQKEDDLLFNGDPSFDIAGLLTVDGALAIDTGDWTEAGSAFRAVAAAVQMLMSHGLYAPYAVIVNPVAYAQLQRVYATSGVLEIQHVRELVQDGVYQTQAIRAMPGVVVSLGPQNFDLAIAQDIITGFLGPEGLNLPFRVFETLVLRIKRPEAICLLRGPAPDPAKLGV